LKSDVERSKNGDPITISWIGEYMNIQFLKVNEYFLLRIDLKESTACSQKYFSLQNVL
jgi:hypothetical protein